MLDKASHYNNKPDASGKRRLNTGSLSGIRDAHRIGALCGGIVPHPSKRRCRIRNRGAAAGALLAEALPHMSSPKRDRAAAALNRVFPNA